MKNFDPGAGDGRRVGVPDNGLREQEPQHTRGALLWIGIASTPRRCRTVTTLCLPGRIPTMRDSHDTISDFLADETAQIALIPRFFDSSWNGR
jgi:hypothetical protein